MTRAPKPFSRAAIVTLAVVPFATTSMFSSTASAAADAEIQLPLDAAVGDMARVDGDFEATIDVFGQKFVVAVDTTMLAEVTSVSPDGEVVTTYLVEAFDVNTSGPVGDSAALESVAGISFTETRDAQGNLVRSEIVDEETLTAQQKQFAQMLVDQGQTSTFSFRDDPVAVGDTWTDDIAMSSDGIEFPVAVELELVALDDTSYTVAVVIDSELDHEADGTAMTGRFDGDGTIVGSTTSSLDQDVELQFTGDFEVTDDGESYDMTMAMDVSIDAEHLG